MENESKMNRKQSNSFFFLSHSYPLIEMMMKK